MDEVSEGLKNAGSSFWEQTSSFLTWIKSFLTWENLFKLIGALIIIFIFWIIFRLMVRGIKKVPEKKLPRARSLILIKFLRYVFYVIIVMYVLSLFGVKLSAIWGAAGIAGVAIGFAAQTSVSNLISGLFVITEGAIKIGDTIIVDGITGVVDSINLISVTVHTLDNEMVRIPNSTIINTNLMNKSFHSKRRLTVTCPIAYGNDLQLALDTYLKAANDCETVLKDPAPAAWIDKFGDSGIDITVAVWFDPKDFLKTKSDLHIAITKEKELAGLETPFNRLDVSMVGDAPKK
ncbi:MAG: mechanosensitive ion channel family protein [Treponema sp.]|nr:mechanosensitive ion channel family protein [Treponema sp.]